MAEESEPTYNPVLPENLAGQFPGPQTISMKRMKRTPYIAVDPVEFGRKFGAFNREQITENYAQAKTIGLDAVETELQSLLNYVPRSSALMRQEIAADNFFNQEQRLQQIAQADPNALSDLGVVRSNALAYSEGRLPDAVQDRALEIGVRSQAADIAATSGFGVQSSAARKSSDLMSAAQRFDISRYGNELLSKNVAQRMDLTLAPTQYSTAGSQVDIMPRISAGQLSTQMLTELNKVTAISPETAFNTLVNQSQFASNLVQRTKEFNKNLRYNVKTFNANAINNFALSLFNYMNSYAMGAANTANVGAMFNVERADQKKAQNIANENRKDTQSNNAVMGWIEALGSMAGLGKDVVDILS